MFYALKIVDHIQNFFSKEFSYKKDSKEQLGTIFFSSIIKINSGEKNVITKSYTFEKQTETIYANTY